MDFHQHLFELPKNLEIFIGRQEFVVQYAAQKKVLHLGCVDEGLVDEKFNQGLLLHDRLSRVTTDLWGVDIDPGGVEWLKIHGYPNIFQADIENIQSLPEVIGQEFELILLTEVLEHLDNPGKFLQALRPLMRPSTELLITVPNAYSIAALVQTWHGRELVHPDHNYWFSYRTITSILSKFGYKITRTIGYTQYNYQQSIFDTVRKKLGLPPSQKTSTVQPGDRTSNQQGSSKGKPNPAGWLKMVQTRLVYRYLLHRSPFFADGLIFIVRTSGE